MCTWNISKIVPVKSLKVPMKKPCFFFKVPFFAQVFCILRIKVIIFLFDFVSEILPVKNISLPWKILVLRPWNLKSNPWKNPKKSPWKVWTRRENLEKSAREKGFAPVKKPGKMVKNTFHGHFWFSRGKKKNADLGGEAFSLIVLN